MHVYGEPGNISWDFFANRIDVEHVEGHHSQTLNFTCERNDMFLAEARHVLDCASGVAEPRISGADGMQTLRVLLAGLESSRTNRAVALS